MKMSLMRSQRSLTCCLTLLIVPVTHSLVREHNSIILTNKDGRLQSPNYPENYPANIDYRWFIYTFHGNRIHLRIDDFELERFHDELQFYDVNVDYPFARITGRCTETHADECLNDDIISDHNFIGIRLLTDHSKQYRGFNLSYQVA